MYPRRHIKKVDGEEYGYWSQVESVRTAKGPRQRVVATIGKLPDFDKEERGGWEEIGRILTGKPQPQDSLFEKTEEPPSWALVNINRVSVERLRSFGDIYLALLLWRQLGFAEKVLKIDDLTIVEGSGISRENRISAKSFLKILEAFEPHMNLMKHNGNEYFKTGTLSGISSRAGYIKGGEGKLYRYVIMTNSNGNSAEKISKKLRGLIE
jgi:hypothetical protein